MFLRFFLFFIVFHFYVSNFLMFLKCFCSIFNVAFLFLLKNIRNYKYDAFLMGKLCLVLFSICTIITVT